MKSAVKNIYLSAFAIGLITACLHSCSGCNGHSITSEERDGARYAGLNRALELAADLHPDTLTIEHVLLDVREREHRLRSAGYDEIADTYIDTFLATLDSVNPSLAAHLK